MSVSLRRQWQEFRDEAPGRRFQGRHQRRSGDAGVLRKSLMIVAGIVVIAIGIVMIVLPGPGLLVMILGAVLIAEESLYAARLLDRADLFIHKRIAAWRARRR